MTIKGETIYILYIYIKQSLECLELDCQIKHCKTNLWFQKIEIPTQNRGHCNEMARAWGGGGRRKV